MRKNFIRVFAAAALTLSFAACSQDDIAPNVITPEMATSYMKVNIAMAGGTSTRADFEAGTRDESEIKKLTLLLYNDNGLVGTGTTTVSPEIQLTDDDNLEQSKNGFVMKLTLEPSEPLPTRMYAFINTDASYATEQEAKDAILEANEIAKGGTAGFVMTNALGTNLTQSAIEIKPEYIFDNADLAGKAESEQIVPIYVERLAAKITVTQASEELDQDNLNYKLVGPDGETAYTLDFKHAKWAPTGTAPDMYSLKRAWDTNITEDYSWAKGIKNYRNYWAEGTYYKTNYKAYINEEGKNPLTYISANDVISSKSEKSKSLTMVSENGVRPFFYVPEHTFGNAAMNGKEFVPKVTGTNVIVVGRYEITGDDADKFKVTYESDNEEGHTEGIYYDFYLTLKGTEGDQTVYYIYSKAEMAEHILTLNGINIDELSIAEGKTILDYFDVVKGDGSDDRAKTQYFVEANEDGEKLLSDEQTLDKGSNGRHYYNGWAYFFAPIQHNVNAGDDKVGTYGVVRNHVYNLTVTEINTLGAALDEGKIGSDPENPDPDDKNDPGEDPIIPDPDEIKDVWINSTINVLSWHAIEQNVKL